MPASTFAELFGAIFSLEAQTQLGVEYGPLGNDLTGTLVVGGGGGSYTINVCVSGVEQDGITLAMKEGADQIMTVSGIPFSPGGSALLGVRDDAGRWLMKVEGSFDGSTATFSITSKQALGLYQGEHHYDVFNLSGYNEDTGEYTNAQFLLTGKVIVDQLNLRLEI